MIRHLFPALMVALCCNCSLYAFQVSGDASLAGVIEEITCTKPSIEEPRAKKTPLDPNADRYRPLPMGAKLTCEGSGSILISEGDKTETVQAGTSLDLKDKSVLAKTPYGFTPAGSRGDEDLITFPPDGGRIRAADFHISWHPPAKAGKVTLSLASSASPVKICCDGSFDGARKQIDVPQAVSALESVSKGDAAARQVTLKIVDSDDRDSSIEFSILSADEDRALDAELAHWSGDAPLLQHLGRAFVFRRYKLFASEALEVESALALAPSSPYLLARSIEAERRANNSGRVKTLSAQLGSAQ